MHKQAGGPASFAPPGQSSPGDRQAPPPPATTPGAALARAADPFADLDFGDIQDIPSPPRVPADPNKTWDNLPVATSETLHPDNGGVAGVIPQPVANTPDSGQLAVSPGFPGAEGAPSVPGSNPWSTLDFIPTPSSTPPAGAGWGNLDAIPSPTNASGRGLGRGMLGKARANTAARPMFNKGRAALEAAPPREQLESPPPAPLDDAAAQAKLQAIMSKTNQTSDYVFATPGLDMRMLGRIDSWIAEVENKDAFKNGHARQTAEYAIAIGRECGLDSKQLETIRQSALVHDVGKLGLPASVLQKPESDLEDTELLNIMKHPIAGAELLQRFPDLQHLAPIVLTHREEFNGEGYPQGLKGEEIPVEARVIAVANGYHSLVSEMRYGPGISPGAAQQKIVEEAGKKYDPKFVQGLLQAIMLQKVPAVC
jgi:HD-GYP domain-containing protein (c-di-GMP phosphodiesterase class II)